MIHPFSVTHQCAVISTHQCAVISLQEIQVLACFHSFHVACLPANGCCKLCDGPLRKIAKDLSESFNKGLLINSMVEQEEDNLTTDQQKVAYMQL